AQERKNQRFHVGWKRAESHSATVSAAELAKLADMDSADLGDASGVNTEVLADALAELDGDPDGPVNTFDYCHRDDITIIALRGNT
ncbi:MAG: hypothetical protein ACRD0P_17330, partial [Stackebrandtia sp.]